MRPRVLLIDDTPALHRLVAAALEIDGIDLLSAYDGTSGIHAAKMHKPDVVLLDVSMPGLSGFEVCELLLVQPETAQIPVMFLSASANPDDRVRGLMYGASDYLTKPFYADELRARVRVALRYKALLELESRRAFRDGLTGLWNRAYLDHRLAADSAASARHGWPLSCVMIDIDHFKNINDTYGHSFGDDTLRAVADRINLASRCDDVPCRYGGEEFVVLCPGVGAADAARLAERIRTSVSGTPLLADVRVTCSLGVADGSPDEGLLAAADRALYRAKHAGRDRVCVAAEAAATVDSRAALSHA
ncbi:MAG TPA: diguanylate cyclase [Tepidisphaeraceae bacterium]|jgi:diguanylate cyclase (GGDEF)-like protein